MKEIDKWEDTKSSFPYEDILDLEHPTSRNHPRLPMDTRAGQFSPFAALTGYEEGISETTRYTSQKKELTEEEKNKLDEVIKEIKRNNNPPIQITYFVKDKRKKGGSYQTVEGTIQKINLYQNKLELQNGIKIPIEDIVKIEMIPVPE
ncbi:MAG: YolD-like family protein [Bacilli bacterium]|nr:YolD-like family protein [Bacilli bacterium]